MWRSRLLILGIALSACVSADEPPRLTQSETIAPLPMGVTNNAVASVVNDETSYVVSFAGLGSGRSHADTLDATLVFDSASGNWHEAAPVPGGVGRLAATAATVGELAYVFGGYTVAADGAEVSTPWVHSFDPATETYTELASMPVPVDDAVAVAFADRYIYLISGWHDLGNVNLVQRYDTRTDDWDQATPIPGTAVFGHAGGIVGNKIVYCDGVRVQAFDDRSRDFVAHGACLLGIINAEDSRRVDWRTIPPHPGAPRYRMAAAGVPTRDAILFIGGSDNPYNYNGIGYNGEPSEPVSGGLLFSLKTLSWQPLPLSGVATMDHRALVPFQNRWLIVGGMLAKQKVTKQVITYEIK